jgi:hypothetical protein
MDLVIKQAGLLNIVKIFLTKNKKEKGKKQSINVVLLCQVWQS